MGDQVGRRREEHVGRYRGADHYVDVHRIGSRFFEQVVHGALSHIRGAEALAFENVAGFDADA